MPKKSRASDEHTQPPVRGEGDNEPSTLRRRLTPGDLDVEGYGVDDRYICLPRPTKKARKQARRDNRRNRREQAQSDIRILRARYTVTRNPIYAFGAFGEAHSSRLSTPEWVERYLMTAARRLMALRYHANKRPRTGKRPLPSPRPLLKRSALHPVGSRVSTGETRTVCPIWNVRPTRSGKKRR